MTLFSNRLFRLFAAFLIIAFAFGARIPFTTEAATTRIIVLTTGTTWTVPSDWNSSNNKIEVIGGGGSGGVSIQISNRTGTGGGGGGYAKATNVSLTPGASVTYAIGSGGAAVSRTASAGNTNGNTGGDTYFCNSTSNCASISGTAVMVGAKGGSAGAGANSGAPSGGAGGAASSAKGGVGGGTSNPGAPYAYSGGAGGSSGSGFAAQGVGGGGAAGANGNGNAGTSLGAVDAASAGGSGDAGSGGAGAAGGNGFGGSSDIGGNKYVPGVSFSGGGGGGARVQDTNHTGAGGAGGLYGGGGGGASGGSHGGSICASCTIASGAGAQGIIFISYTTTSDTVTIARNAKFLSNLDIRGLLSKGSGTFVIDHPQAPATKLLYHSFVESPDVKNLYDGIITLDKNGEATIKLPDYFEALNKDFRYQFSSLGGAMPNLYVKTEVEGNGFVIGGGTPGGKISWQVTGTRKDPYILAHPIQVEVEKGPGALKNKGECLYEPACTQ